MKKLLTIIVLFVFGVTAKAQLFRNEWIDYSKTYYKFKVSFGIDPVTIQPIKKGLVRIKQADLASIGLGSIQAENFQLFRNGVEVPIYTSVSSGLLGSSDYIEFWGEINDGKLDADLYRNMDFQLSDIWSLQEDEGTYFLTVNTSSANKRYYATPNHVSGTSLSPTLYFMNTLSYTNRVNRNEGFAAQASKPLYSSSYDRGEGYSTRSIRPVGSSCGQGSFTVDLTDLKPYLAGPNMTLKVSAVGNANNARKVKINLNGDSVDLFQMDYFYDKVDEISGIPVSKIASGTASIQHINKSIVDCDEFILMKDELIYPRTLDCNNKTSLELKLPLTFTGHYLKFYNLDRSSGGIPVLYDITNGKRYEADLSIPDTVRFVTEQSMTAYNLVLVQSSSANALAINASTISSRNFINYANLANQGDYIIISNPLIYGSGPSNYVEQYKQYRSTSAGGGYNAIIADINQLVDQFAYGVKLHPLSIKNFVRYARSNFLTTPKFVFLIGKGLNYIDYRNNEAASDISYQNLVPTWGSPASDNLLVSEDLSNAIPAISIGRLSAISADEVGNYLTKVKQYDSAQASNSNLIKDKGWMKNVLQVAGTNDPSIAATLDDILKDYSNIMKDVSMGGNVRNYDKLANTSEYTQSINEFKNIYEQGTSIVSYFGHSSSTNLDFNLDDPDHYNNFGKYPIFLVNGCDAANYYVYEPSRLSLRSTISEKFILEPSRGAIGYVATTGFGMINYLDSFTTKVIKNLSANNYGNTFGQIFKQGISDVLTTTGFNDYYARYHSEQFVFHGDPAIKVNSFSKPDYAIEPEQMTLTSNYISVADDSFHVKVRIHNIGRSVNDSINFSLARQLPSGSSSIIFTKKFPAIAAIDSVVVGIPIVANRDKGTNILTAFIDNTTSIDEISESNNTASISIDIRDDEIVPTFPYKYAIVNTTNFKLQASTANPVAVSKTYIMEIDTTALFNSPIKASATKTSVGGAIEFDKIITLQDSTTYYWRVAIQGNTRWNTSSFTYRASAPYAGFQQRHFYQLSDNTMDRIYLDSATRKYVYRDKLNNLFVTHAIYPTSGTEDQQFSIHVNGAGIIASACLGQSVIINVFDTLTFKPWENLTNPYGAEPTCDVSRKYNFEYHYIDADGRNRARQFLESIPNGTLVAVRLVYDWDVVWANEWAADSTIYGANNTLYSFLKKQGLPIDSFYFARTFGIIFKKNDSTHFSPKWEFSESAYDRVVMSVNFNSKDTLGYITSKKFGPAKTWRNAKWKGNGNTNSKVELSIYGVGDDGSETKLFTIDTTQTNYSISSINANQYPYVRLQLKNQDSITAAPYQLKDWSVEFDEVPEGAIAPNLYFNIPDSAGQGVVGGTNFLKGGIAFKNVSKVAFDSLTAKIVLTPQSGAGSSYTFNLSKLKPLNPSDTSQVPFNIDISTLPQQMYNMYLVVNENGTQDEVYLFNNYIYKYVYLKTNVITPVQIVSFDAVRSNNTVNVIWNVAQEVNIASYTIERSINGRDFEKIGEVNAFGNRASNQYSFTDNKPNFGKNYYRLKIAGKDGNINYSAVRLISFDKTTLVSVYPNPAKEKIYISVSKADSKVNTLSIYNSVGQQIITKSFTSVTQVDVSKYAAGTYVVQVDDGNSIQIFKIQKN